MPTKKTEPFKLTYTKRNGTWTEDATNEFAVENAMTNN
jgi:hypothetical protein